MRICLLIVLSCVLFGCQEPVITNPDMFPTKDLSGRLVLMPHPADSNDIILGFGKKTDKLDYSELIALRDCFSNELISCVDSMGVLKDSIVLCVGEVSDYWENDRLENLYKMYLSSSLTNVTLKLYEGMRHEILNETDRHIVYKDVLEFLSN